jgi:SAM-dependent methyltransferase
MSVARWNRAARALRIPAGSRVLDLGCAFGFGTRLLTRRYHAFGHDLSPKYIGRARRSVPQATFTCGPADSVPYPGGIFDAILLLDVLEHVPDQRIVVKEITRLLRPGGQLILSVPNTGLLAGLDSLNLYRRLLGDRAPPPTDDPSWRQSPVHRHYSASEIASLLDPHFRICKVEYTGLGLAEIVNLALLLLFRATIRVPRVYDILQYLYFGVYLAEDLLPTGPWGYHLMVSAERLPDGAHGERDDLSPRGTSRSDGCAASRSGDRAAARSRVPG